VREEIRVLYEGALLYRRREVNSREKGKREEAEEGHLPLYPFICYLHPFICHSHPFICHSHPFICPYHCN
jgi:hypothetical protein